jgi:hypothetical protein
MMQLVDGRFACRHHDMHKSLVGYLPNIFFAHFHCISQPIGNKEKSNPTIAKRRTIENVECFMYLECAQQFAIQFHDRRTKFELIQNEALKNWKSGLLLKGTVNNVNNSWRLMCEPNAYPTIPLLANSQQVTQSL